MWHRGQILERTVGADCTDRRRAPADQIAAAAALIGETGAWVLSDEVYSQMVYDGPFTSIAAAPGMLDRTILLDGCSKTFAMTGWRCGFAAVPELLVDPLVRFFTTRRPAFRRSCNKPRSRRSRGRWTSRPR